jgi:hypothetical protein
LTTQFAPLEPAGVTRPRAVRPPRRGGGGHHHHCNGTGWIPRNGAEIGRLGHKPVRECDIGPARYPTPPPPTSGSGTAPSKSPLRLGPSCSGAAPSGRPAVGGTRCARPRPRWRTKPSSRLEGAPTDGQVGGVQTGALRLQGQALVTQVANQSGLLALEAPSVRGSSSGWTNMSDTRSGGRAGPGTTFRSRGIVGRWVGELGHAQDHRRSGARATTGLRCRRQPDSVLTSARSPGLCPRPVPSHGRGHRSRWWRAHQRRMGGAYSSKGDPTRLVLPFPGPHVAKVAARPPRRCAGGYRRSVTFGTVRRNVVDGWPGGAHPRCRRLEQLGGCA